MENQKKNNQIPLLNKFVSVKFAAIMISIIIASFMMALDKMNAVLWTNFTLGALGIFCAGNVGTKIINKKNGASQK